MSENINIKSDEIKEIAHGQAVVEARQATDGECKILSASAWAVTTPGEIFAGEIRYIGKVTFDCLVMIGGAIECITTVAEFSDKITSPEIYAGMNATLIPEVINVESSVDAGGVKLVAVVDTTALSVISREYSCLSVPDEGVYAEKRPMEYMTASAALVETVYVTDSVAAGGASAVLCARADIAMGGVSTADDEVKVSGTVYTDAVVKDNDGTVRGMRIATPFAKSIAAHGVKDGDIAYATAAVSDVSATCVDGRIETSATVMIAVSAFESRTAEAVTDVFCSDYEIEPARVTTVLQTCEPVKTVTDTVDGQIPIPADKPAADNVVCVTGVFCTVSDIKSDGKIVAEGLVGGDIVYYNAENNVYDTLAFRLPFGLPLAVHTDMKNIRASATVTDIAVRVRRESVFDIKAEVSFALEMSNETECTVIESVKLGEELQRPDASVIVHIAKPGETLWQAAKALCCSPESVESQNAFAAPYSGGERLVNFCARRK